MFKQTSLLNLIAPYLKTIQKNEATDYLLLVLCIFCWLEFPIVNVHNRTITILIQRTYVTATTRQQHRFLL